MIHCEQRQQMLLFDQHSHPYSHALCRNKSSPTFARLIKAKQEIRPQPPNTAATKRNFSSKITNNFVVNGGVIDFWCMCVCVCARALEHSKLVWKSHNGSGFIRERHEWQQICSKDCITWHRLQPFRSNSSLIHPQSSHRAASLNCSSDQSTVTGGN